MSWTMNLPMTHWIHVLAKICRECEEITYALALEMSASEAMHVLVEVVHLETFELFRNCFDVLFFILLLDLDSISIPMEHISIV